MKLRSKLLVSFILATSVLVITVFFLLRWSFEHGAATFERQEDQRQIAALAVELAGYYRVTNSWQAFVAQPERWHAWLRDHDTGPRHSPGPQQRFEPSSAPTMQPPPDNRAGSSPPSEGPPQDHVMPFFLLDSERQPLQGRYRQGSLIAPIELLRDGEKEIVGYLGLPPPPSDSHDFWQTPLVAKQRELLVYFSVGALLISMIAAVPLSARWTRRILQLHDHVGKLSQGDYDQCMDEKGDDEIAALATHLNHLGLSLAEAQRQRQQMTADVSHELRTPVSSLQANIEALQDGVLPLTQDSVAQLHQQVRRLSQLIDDLYQLSLADAGVLQYNKSDCDLLLLLKHLVSGYRAQFQRERLSLDISLATNQTLYVWGDSVRLTQVFTNLLENSRRYTSSPGKVQLLVEQIEDMVSITISDSAPGVDKSLHDHLTDRLFRVEHSRSRDAGGAGLGLNLCAAIVRAHGGELLFADSELGGLAVTVKLPIMKG